VVIESDRENQGHDEEQDQHVFVVRTDYEQEKEADQQYDELSGDDVGENCTHKKAVFAFEKSHAVRAVMPDVKRLVNNLRLATRRTPQSYRTPQDPLDLFRIYFQGVRAFYAMSPPQERADRRFHAKALRQTKDAKMRILSAFAVLCVFA